MKRLREYRVCYLLTISSSVLYGCASLRPPGELETAGVIEPVAAVEDKAWDDMSISQKIGHCLWWPFQWSLLCGGSALSGHGL
jgi:hypothetical protein